MVGTGMRRWALVVAVGAVAALWACTSDSGSTGSTDDSLDCTLLTNEEVSAFAGKELVGSGSDALGCAYVAPGATVGEFSIRSYRQSGDAAAAGTKLAPSLEIVPFAGVGDDAVALATSDGSVNFLIARKGNAFVELVMTFMQVTKDPAELQRAGQLASTALSRLVAAT